MISKKQNIVFSLLFSAIFLLIFSSSYSQKTLRVGYINMDYILENLDDYKLANQEYSLKLDKWKREIEKKNNDLMFGGDGLDIEPTDELKRFEGLVVPTGLYIGNNADNNSRVFKKTESKVLPDDLFQKLFEKVTKPLKYNRRTTMKKRK